MGRIPPGTLWEVTASRYRRRRRSWPRWPACLSPTRPAPDFVFSKFINDVLGKRDPFAVDPETEKFFPFGVQSKRPPARHVRRIGDRELILKERFGFAESRFSSICDNLTIRIR